MPLLFHRLLIVGVGLIGGSLGLAAKARGLVEEVVGFGRTEANLKLRSTAASLIPIRLIRPKRPREPTASCWLFRFRRPGRSCSSFIPYLPPGCIVTDAGSVKAPVVAALEALVPPRCPVWPRILSPGPRTPG